METVISVTRVRTVTGGIVPLTPARRSRAEELVRYMHRLKAATIPRPVYDNLEYRFGWDRVTACAAIRDVRRCPDNNFGLPIDRDGMRVTASHASQRAWE